MRSGNKFLRKLSRKSPIKRHRASNQGHRVEEGGSEKQPISVMGRTGYDELALPSLKVGGIPGCS